MTEYEDKTYDNYRAQICMLLIIAGIAVFSIYVTKISPSNMQEKLVSESKDNQYIGNNAMYAIGGSGERNIDSYLIHVPMISQNDYPTGCESVTSVMALQYAGYDVSVDEFIDNYLRIGAYYEQDGRYYGNSPYYYFIGNPRTGSGFGCFAPVIYEALQAASGNGEVKDLTGITLPMAVQEYLAKGIPVIIWATINMQPSYDGGGWTLLETGKYYTWPAEEHCLLLVGADDEYYYFNDPKQENTVAKYEKKVAEQRYFEMGSQALAVLPQ